MKRMLHAFLTTWFLISITSAFPVSLSQDKGMSRDYQDRVMRMERLLQEGNNNEDGNTNGTLILAAERTCRVDPLDNLAYYAGGWDFSNAHYMASVIFTAAPLFITSAVWFLLPVLRLLCACLCCCCYCCCWFCCGHQRKKKTYEHVELTYTLSFSLLIIFTVVAISGCIVVIVNEEQLNASMVKTLEFIVNKGASVFESLLSVLKALASAEDVAVNELSLPDEIKEQIESVKDIINGTADAPRNKSLATKTAIHAVLAPARIYVHLIAGLMLILTVLGFLCALLGWKLFIFMLVSLGWVLVTAALISSGVFLIFRTLIADTCVAMDDWVQNPTANSAINLHFLPCLNYSITHKAINILDETTYSLINITNEYITGVANKDPDVNDTAYYGQAGPLVPIACNPFNLDMSNRTCTPNEVNFDNAAEEWKKYVCEVSDDGKCTTEGRLTPESYKQLTASTNISSSLNSSKPTLVDLASCTFVLSTFKEISTNHCPYLRRYSYRTYIGLAMISVSIMFSVILWACYARERRHLKSTRKAAAKSAEISMSEGYGKLRGESDEKPLRW